MKKDRKVARSINGTTIWPGEKILELSPPHAKPKVALNRLLLISVWKLN